MYLWGRSGFADEEEPSRNIGYGFEIFVLKGLEFVSSAVGSGLPLAAFCCF